MAPLSDDDRVLIRILRNDKGFNSFQMIKEFPNRGWTKSTLNRLIQKIDATGTSSRKPHERIHTARTFANIARVPEFICSHDDDPGSTSKSPREIQRETGISRSTVRRIAKDDLKLKIFRRREVQQLSDSDAKKRLQACKRLKKRMTDDKIERTWFSDEKIFTVQSPTNTQNDRIYACVLRKPRRDTWKTAKRKKTFLAECRG